MKFIKIFLFTILAIFSFGFISHNVYADTVSTSLVVTVDAPAVPASWSGYGSCSAGSKSGTCTEQTGGNPVTCASLGYTAGVNTTSVGCPYTQASWSGYGSCSAGSKSGTCTEQTGGNPVTCASLGYTAGVNTTTSGCSQPTPTGTISASNCTISSGGSSCTSNISWNTTNPVGTSSVTTPTNITVGSGNNSSATYSVVYGTRSFYLYNNGTLLAVDTSTSSCVSGTSWNGSTCAAPTPTSGTISASNCTISSGGSSCTSNISWNTTNPVGTSSVTTPTNITVGSGNNSSATYSVVYGTRSFYLYNNGTLLAVDTSTASCASGTSWDSASGTCKDNVVVIPTPPSNGGGNGGGSGTGTWSAWSPIVDTCGVPYTQSSTCTGGSCTSPTGSVGAIMTRSIPNLIDYCPIVSVNATPSSGQTLVADGIKVPYNSFVTINWSLANVNQPSCTCTYSDAKISSAACPVTTTYTTPALKRKTIYTMDCTGSVYGQSSKSFTVFVDPINTKYIEQ